MTHLYRIWYSDGNDRSELGRVSAPDIDAAVEYAKKQYLQLGVKFYQEDGDHEHLYLMIDTCKDCEFKEGTDKYCETRCETCERSEYLEIMIDDDAEPEFKTIYGINEYANIEVGLVPTPHNEILAAAWAHDLETGLAALNLYTIEENPHLEAGFSKELIAESRLTLKQFLKVRKK